MTSVGCVVGPPITGQLNLKGIPVLGLVDTRASVTCMGFSVWWQYHTQWGPLNPFEGVVNGTHGKPFQIAGKTQHLNLQWGEARGRASFIVIIGLESPPVLIGMDIMRPLRVHIDVTNGTGTPAQPDPQTIHLNAAQAQDLPPTSCALLLQAIDIPAETARLAVAITLGPARTSMFAQRKASLRLCPGCPRLPVDPKCGSRSTITAPSHSACTPDKLWAH